MKAIIRCRVTGFNNDPVRTVRTALAHITGEICIISIQVNEDNANSYLPYRYPRNVDPSFDRNYSSKNSVLSSNRHDLSSFSSSRNLDHFQQAYNQPSDDPFKNETVEVVVEFAPYNHSIGLYNPNLISEARARKLITDAISLRGLLQFVRFEGMPQLNPFESHLPYTMPNPKTTPSIFDISTSLNPSQATSHHKPTFSSSHSSIASFDHGYNRPCTTTIIPPDKEKKDEPSIMDRFDLLKADAPNLQGLLGLPVEILQHILGFLEPKHYVVLESVCSFLQLFSAINPYFNKLINPKFVRGNKTARQIFFENPEARISNIGCDIKGRDYLRRKLKPKELFEHFQSEGIIPKDILLSEKHAWGKLSTILQENGLIALRSKLIEPEQIELFYDIDLLSIINPGTRDSYHKLSKLLTPNGLTALREKLLTVEQASRLNIPDLTALLSDIGLVALRERLITPEQAKGFYSLSDLLTPNGLIALREKLLTIEQAAHIFGGLRELLSDIGLVALRESLITPKQAKRLYLYRKKSDKHNNLSDLLTPNGLIALREKLLTVEQAAHICGGLRALLSDIGLVALRESLITPEQAKRLYLYRKKSDKHNNLSDLLTPNGLIALREKLLTVKQAKRFYNLSDLLTPNGLTALREKLLTVEQAAHISGLRDLLSDIGLLREGLITPEQAKEIHSSQYYYNLSLLLTPNGLIALREGLITPEQAKGFCHSGLSDLLTPNGLTALREKLLTVEQAAHISGLRDLLLEALREGLITPEQAKGFCHSGLSDLLTPNGLTALREKLLTVEQAAHISDLRALLLRALLLEALFRREEGLITPEQAKEIHSSQYYYNLSLLLTPNGLIAFREGLITPEQAKGFCHNNLSDLLTPNGLTALREELLTVEQASRLYISNLRALLSDIGLVALRGGLITPEQAEGFYHSGRASGPYDNLSDLLTPNGLIALREKLLTVEQANGLYCNLSDFLTPNGLIALREKLLTVAETACFSRKALVALTEKGLITPEQANGLYGNLSVLLTPNGLIALREKLLTVELAACIGGLRALLSDIGLVALRENLITANDSYNPDINLTDLLTPNGLTALREKLLTVEQTADFSLFRRVLVKLREEGSITPEQANRPYGNLSDLLTPNGLIALREKLLTVKQAVYISDLRKTLLSDIGLVVLRESLITAEQAKGLFFSQYYNNLSLLLTPNGLIALRERKLTFEQAVNHTNLKEFLASLSQENKEKDNKSILSAMCSPITSCGRNHDILVQKLKSVAEGKETLTKNFFKSIDNKDYSQAVRIACTTVDPIGFELIKIIFSYKGEFNINLKESPGKDQRTAIHYAALNGNIALFKFLEEMGADKTIPDARGKSAEQYMHEFIVKTNEKEMASKLKN